MARVTLSGLQRKATEFGVELLVVDGCLRLSKHGKVYHAKQKIDEPGALVDAWAWIWLQSLELELESQEAIKSALQSIAGKMTLGDHALLKEAVPLVCAYVLPLARPEAVRQIHVTLWRIAEASSEEEKKEMRVVLVCALTTTLLSEKDEVKRLVNQQIMPKFLDGKD